MEKTFTKILKGYEQFRQKYANGDQSIMQLLSHHGQQPEIMVIACCDSRVDPALILQCDPGDLFVVRNVANIVPPFEKDEKHHGTSAALEFGIKILNVKYLILLGHSQCGGIQALMNPDSKNENDFIHHWVSQIQSSHSSHHLNDCAKLALNQSYKNCLTFPWIHERFLNHELMIHRWFFDIKEGKIFTYSEGKNQYLILEGNNAATS